MNDAKSLSTPILRESVTNKELNKLKVNTNNIQHQYSSNMNKHHKISLYGGNNCIKYISFNEE